MSSEEDTMGDDYGLLEPQDVIDLMTGRLARLDQQVQRVQERIRVPLNALRVLSDAPVRVAMLRREEIEPLAMALGGASAEMIALLHFYDDAERRRKEAKEQIAALATD